VFREAGADGRIQAPSATTAALPPKSCGMGRSALCERGSLPPSTLCTFPLEPGHRWRGSG